VSKNTGKSELEPKNRETENQETGDLVPVPVGKNQKLGTLILEDIEMMSDDSVGVAGDNMGTLLKAAEGVPGRALSPINEVGNSSRAPTPMKPRSSTPIGIEKGTESRRSNASGASGASSSEDTAEIKPEGANWSVGGKLAKLGGDFKGNPFKAVVDLVDHDGLQLKRDITLRGVAEEMLTMQCLVSVDNESIHTYRIFFSNVMLTLLAGFPPVHDPVLLYAEGFGFR
jgi:hypothetical protein